MINKVFAKQIRRNVETFINDIIVKNEKAKEHVAYLIEVFDMLRKFGVKFHVEKCVLGVIIRKFLGFMVS